MKNTIIFYETHHGCSKLTAEKMAYIIGNAKVYSIANPPDYLDKYQNIVFVFSFYGFETLKLTKEYIQKNLKNLQSKKVAIVGVGLAKNDLENYKQKLINDCGCRVDFSSFVLGELSLNNLTDDEKNLLDVFGQKVGMVFKNTKPIELKNIINVAVDIRDYFLQDDNPVDENTLKKDIDDFIGAHNTFSLATSSGNFSRCTPVEYLYYNNNFYIFTEGGLKFRALLENEFASIGIYNEYKNMGNLKGLQISVKSCIVEPFSDEYNSFLEKKHLNAEIVKKMPVDFHLLRLVPYKLEFLNSDYKKIGKSSKQILNIKS